MKSFLILYFFFSSIALFSQNVTPISTQHLHKLDSIATQDVPAKAPGIAAAIIQNKNVVFKKYAGFADLSDSSAISSTTRFNLASNGKQFTALAILFLMDENKIQLKDDIRKFLPSLFPKIKSKITIENLLSHTSGIRDVYDLLSLQGYTWWKQSLDNNDVLEIIRKQEEPNFLPGTNYLYSNSNYILLALIIERVSGQSFRAYTNAMFKKLNMPNTSFEDDYTQIQGPIAKAYFNFGSWTTFNWIWKACGDGNLFSTLEDQIQWEKIVQGEEIPGIKRTTIIKSQQLISDLSNTYGYGLEFGSYKGLTYRFHEGATGAWKATILRFPEHNVSMITLTNTGKSIPSMQTRQMADVFFGLKSNANYFITQPTSVGKYVSEEEIVGTYLTENNFTFQFEKRDNKLYLKRTGRNDILLEREADNIFHQKNDPLFKQEFRKNEKDEMIATAYYTSHAPYSLTRASANWARFDYNLLTGKFFNSETGTAIIINYKSDQHYEVKIGTRDLTTGLLITPTKLLVDSYSIEFRKNKKKKTEALFLNGDRIKNVKFVRIE